MQKLTRNPKGAPARLRHKVWMWQEKAVDAKTGPSLVVPDEDAAALRAEFPKAFLAPSVAPPLAPAAKVDEPGALVDGGPTGDDGASDEDPLLGGGEKPGAGAMTAADLPDGGKRGPGRPRRS